MPWSQVKKRVLASLADSVRGRVTIGATTYRMAPDFSGRAWIAIDGHEILNMASAVFDYEHYRITQTTGSDDKTAARQLHEQGIFGEHDWHTALVAYLNLPIDRILHSANPLVRAMGMLDRRVGKRRLRSLDASREHPLVKRLYALRCQAEDIPASVSTERRGLTAALTPAPPSAGSAPDKRILTERAAGQMVQSKRERSIRSLIRAIHRKEVSSEQLTTPIAREIAAGFDRAADRETLLETLLLVESRSKLLKALPHARGVIALTHDAAQWVRPLQAWQPPSHNPDRQFSSLARHLWAKYDVPLFMDKAWLSGGSTQQQWFRHVGRGHNIRTAAGLPVALTKKRAHHFLQAPESYSIDAAFRWGQVHALGGDARLANALLGTRVATEFGDNEFWLSVLRFFIRNPMLDPAHVNPIIDYIWHQRYEPRVVFVEPGVAEEIGPEQPHFSMAGRTVDALLRAVEAWHRQLGKEAKGGQLQWKATGIEEYVSVEGTKTSKNMRVWRIRELLSSQELVVEGRQMRHCVATYAQSCRRGTCSIWTMGVETDAGLEKLLTIEVVNRDREIRQVRGHRNRLPTDKEKEVIRRWSAQAGLTLASYI